jgi:hypothetical protein
MEKHYVVFVDFTPLFGGHTPVTQTLDVHSAGAEFSALLHALVASSDIAAIRVCYKTTSGKMNVMTKADLGMPNIDKVK